MSNSGGNYVDKVYTKTDSYRDELGRIQDVGGCPFCPGSPSYSFDPAIQPELFRNEHWFIVPVRDVEGMRWKYPNARHHFMVVAARHATHLLELAPDELLSLGLATQWLLRELEMPGGGFAMRFGPTRMTGASVQHLHLHVIEPEIDETTDRAKVVTFPFG